MFRLSDRMQSFSLILYFKKYKLCSQKEKKWKSKCHVISTQIKNEYLLGILAELLPTLKWLHNVGKNAIQKKLN